jgi:tetratricopeptide (TPR) repeat protein
MKKIVLASVIALAVISLVSAPTLRAQDQSTITIKDPAEYNAYSQATTQADPKAKAAAMESFLQTYPQSVVKADVLNMLVDTYQQLGDLDHALSAASRLLQLDPGNFKAILISVAIKKSQCQKAEDPKTGVATDPTPCDDAAALAQKGLTAAKPAATSADDWKKQTAVAYPIFHSAIALDDAAAKKDFKAAEAEYSAELMLYTDDQSKSAGLQDSLLLAQAYGAPGPGQDLVKAVWFYARVWDFAPPAYKTRIEPTLEYLYKKYHGALDGLDAIKTQAATTTFPPGTLIIKPAATPQEKIHAILETTPDLTTLALADKELVLAFGAKDDADKLWALMKDKETPVPGVVIDATATVIKMAVTDDAKQSKTPDFIVNMKEPIPDKDIPKAGDEFKLMSEGGPELDGTYDTYTQIPATDTVAQSAQIVLRDAFIQEKKKAPVHKPAAGHRPAAH